MAVYLVEMYLSRQGARDLGALEQRVRRAAEDLTREGMEVRHVRSVFVPADETCFHLFDAASEAAVRAAGERAAIVFDRVSEAFERPLNAASDARSTNSTKEATS